MGYVTGTGLGALPTVRRGVTVANPVVKPVVFKPVANITPSQPNVIQTVKLGIGSRVGFPSMFVHSQPNWAGQDDLIRSTRNVLIPTPVPLSLSWAGSKRSPKRATTTLDSGIKANNSAVKVQGHFDRTHANYSNAALPLVPGTLTIATQKPNEPTMPTGNGGVTFQPDTPIISPLPPSQDTTGAPLVAVTGVNDNPTFAATRSTDAPSAAQPTDEAGFSPWLLGALALGAFVMFGKKGRTR